MTRRRFVSLLGGASAGLFFEGCTRSRNPLGSETALEGDQVPLPRHNGPGSGVNSAALARVAVAEAASYDRGVIKNQVEAMFGALGGLADIIRPGDRVGIKINLTGGTSYFNRISTPPFELYLTHPEIVRAVGELCLDAGAAKIYVLESVYEWESFTCVDPASGLSHESVAKALGGEVCDTNQKTPFSGYARQPVAGGGLIYDELMLNGRYQEIDCFISLPKAKRHASAGITHAMKNLVGILPVPSGLYNNGAGHRAGIHDHTHGNSDLCRVILDLNRARPIHLSVNDAVFTCLKGEGPWGSAGSGLNQERFNTLIAAKSDMVAADSVATSVLGYDPMSADFSVPFPGCLNYLKLAHEMGMGICDPAQIEVVDASGNTRVERRGGG